MIPAISLASVAVNLPIILKTRVQVVLSAVTASAATAKSRRIILIRGFRSMSIISNTEKIELILYLL